MMEELVSVIVNVYNGEKFIEKCLNSIINQTYKNLEIIIVNDGSTDKTASICEKFKDERIILINQKNIGLSLSRNVGIDKASGEYLFFVDVDDFIELDVIEYLYKLCKNYGVKMSTCRPLDIYDYNFKTNNIKENIEIISSQEMLKKILLSKDRAGTIWNKMIKKELFDNIRFENRIINDVTVTYKICIKAEKIAFSNQEKYYYLRHSNSITGKQNENRTMDLYNASIERYHNIKKVFPNFLENEIGLILIIMHIYCNAKEKTKTFLKEKNAIQLCRKLFSIKMLTIEIGYKDKIKMILFLLFPNLYQKIARKYNEKKYKFKM